MAEMQQLELTPATLRTAIEDEIRDAGGWAAVSQALYPDKYKDSPDKAENHLRNSVNPDHSQKLCVYQHQVIKDLARKRAGRVASIVFDCKEHGYTTPQAITPEQEIAGLEKALGPMLENIQAVVKRIEVLQDKKK